MKRRLFTVISILLSLSLVACGQSSSGDLAGHQGSQPGTALDPITLDWYVNYSWFVTGWGENLVSKKITEETGVSVNFITPIGSEEEKLNALIASDSLPDVITLGWWEPQVEEMISKGMVYSLNELTEMYDTDFFEVADESVVNWYKQEDGNIYCYPNSSYTPNDVETHDNIPSNQTFLVRKDIYEAIGSPDMTTQEGFYEAIKKAVEVCPEVDGEPLIPIGGTGFDETGCAAFDQYLQNFLAIPFEKDGVYYDRNLDPEYLSWLKLFRRLNAEGYIPADTYVDQRTQISEKIAEGRYFCLIYQRTDLADQEKMLYATKPDQIYIAVDGPRNSNGDPHVLPTTGITGWTVTMIPKNCKDPERAIRFMEYFMSEHGQKIISLGVEGEMYEMVDGKPVLFDEVSQMLNTNRSEYDAVYGGDDTYWMLQDNVMQMDWIPKTEEPLRQLAEWTYPYSQYRGQYEVMMVESGKLGESYAKCKKLWSETLKSLMLAESDEAFDAILEDYLVEREAYDYQAILDEETKQINRNKKKLGLN